MSAYIISYDLRNGTPFRYQALEQAIKAYGTWAHVTESTWIVVTEQSASDIFDNLGSLLLKTDRLFVLKSGKEAAWYNLLSDSTWMKRFL